MGFYIEFESHVVEICPSNIEFLFTDIESRGSDIEFSGHDIEIFGSDIEPRGFVIEIFRPDIDVFGSDFVPAGAVIESGRSVMEERGDGVEFSSRGMGSQDVTIEWQDRAMRAAKRAAGMRQPFG